MVDYLNDGLTSLNKVDLRFNVEERRALLNYLQFRKKFFDRRLEFIFSIVKHYCRLGMLVHAQDVINNEGSRFNLFIQLLLTLQLRYLTRSLNL